MSEDIIMRQEYNQCVAASFVNGMIALKDNYLNKFVKNLGVEDEEGIQQIMQGFVNEIYRQVDKNERTEEITFPTDLETALKKIKSKESFPGFDDEYSFKFAGSIPFEKIIEYFKEKKAFVIGFSPDTFHHVICYYKYDNSNFYYKESLENYPQPQEVSESEFEQICNHHKNPVIIIKK